MGLKKVCRDLGADYSYVARGETMEEKTLKKSTVTQTNTKRSRNDGSSQRSSQARVNPFKIMCHANTIPIFYGMH